MKKQKNGTLFLVFAVGLWILSIVQISFAQDIRWLRVSELQTPINEVLAEYEGEFTQGNTDFLSWPAQYGIDQTTMRMTSLWIGCKNFDDPVEGKVKSVKVVGSGPKSVADVNQIFEKEIKLIGKYPHPIVVVDDQNATVTNTYDLVDDLDGNMDADRMVVVKCNSSIGISVTKKVMVFANSQHGNYVIYDYVFENTGIIDRAGTVKSQTLQDVWFYSLYRFAFAGVTSNAFGSTWGAFSSQWGNSTINHSFGDNPAAPEFNDPTSPLYQMRGFYSWYGPNKDRTVPYAADWGCPNEAGDGVMGSAKYGGCTTLYADVGPNNQTDDLSQPKTTWFIGPDITINSTTSPSQYNEIFMADRYAAMSEGHPDRQHDDIVGEDYPINYVDARRQTGGGVAQGQGFGPYTLAPGDSIHIVFAEGISGLSWEKCREVGANWVQWYRQTGQPALRMPDGTSTTDFNLYKRRWVETGKDSILKTYRAAMKNYESGYKLPQAPPPPQTFTVTSGGDRIRLSWADNAESAPHFNGYVIYRSRGNVLDYRTVYEKLFECDRTKVVHSFDDITAVRGFDYYYYIQSKDDGTQNEVEPGRPLYSSLFWTVTSVPATLQRPAVSGPMPFDTTSWRLTESRGAWSPDSVYRKYDAVTYNASNYVCIVDSSSGTKTPDIDNANWKLTTARGAWASGTKYNAYDAVAYNAFEFVTFYSISGGQGLDLVRVVPNPYDIRARLFQYGDQSQYDRIAFYGLPPVCKMKIFTERGDLIWEKDHTRGTGDELWDSMTSSGQIIASGIYILYVEEPGGKSVHRKFVVIR